LSDAVQDGAYFRLDCGRDWSFLIIGVLPHLGNGIEIYAVAAVVILIGFGTEPDARYAGAAFISSAECCLYLVDFAKRCTSASSGLTMASLVSLPH